METAGTVRNMLGVISDVSQYICRKTLGYGVALATVGVSSGKPRMGMKESSQASVGEAEY